MTARSGDWYLVGYDSDPIPTSEWDVRRVTEEMRERANDAAELRETLRGLAQLDGWRGETATTFADKADEVLDDLGKVEDRYDRAAQALSSWEDDVATARDATWSALSDAETANDTIRSNPEFTGTGEPPADQDTRDSRRESAEDELSAARAAMHNAMEALEEAAGRAENDIEDAADIWDDGWWGNFKGWVRDSADVIHAIVQVLEVVAFVLGAVILVLAIVAAAPVALIAAAVAVGALLLIGQTMLAAADTGKADLEDVGWTLIGLAATLVGGRALTSAARGLKALVPAMSARINDSARASALTRLVGSNRVQFNNALRITNPRNNLYRWAQGLKNNAAATGNAASWAVDDAVRLQPTRLHSVLAQSRELAQLRTSLSSLRNMGPTPGELARMNRIQHNLDIALGYNTVGTAIWAKGIPDNISGAWDLATDPPWSTQPTS